MSSEEADPTKAQEPSRPRAARYLRFVLVQLLIVAALVVCIEFALGFMGVAKLDNPHEKPPSTYPKHPNEFVKIAVFGGSAAAATYSPRGIDDLLDFELRARFPDRQFYVKNYASHGEPFHRHQAEYAKRLVGKYDFVLIYCGNNEAENWYDDSGYWRTPEYKDARDLVFSPPTDAANSPFLAKQRAWLGEHSRIFAMASRVKSSMHPPVTKNQNYDYEEFEQTPSIPETELAAIVTNFEQDIREICVRGQQHATQVLLSTTATFETWPPSYSTFRPGLAEAELEQWRGHYANGMHHIEAGEFKQAITAFELAATIDASVAILNYRIGYCHLQLEEHKTARKFFAKAIDGDGHYFRPHSELHAAASRLANEFDNLHYVDVVAAIHGALEGGIRDEELFTDICHPSFLGYVIIAQTYLDHLRDLDPLSGHAAEESGDTDWRQIAHERYEDLKISAEEVKIAAAQNILYCFDLMHFSAYPDRCVAQIEKLMTQVVEVGPEDPMVEAFNSVCRARLALRDGDRQKAADEINIALLASPQDLDMILDLKAWNHYIEDEFTEAGIVYVKDLRRFELKD